jgi:hypothetical protein
MTRQAGASHAIILKHWNELPPPLLILAAPRSFTSLVCAMLGQHPQMYGLPETHLLRFETMAERTEFDAQATYPMSHGLLRAVAQLYFAEQTAAAIRKARHWLSLRSQFTTDFMFRVLMDRVFPRIAVDKSPDMADHPGVLERVFARFPQARFIHLLRHPRGHAESVMKYLQVRANRGPVPPSHWLLRISSLPPPGPAADDSNEKPVLDPQYGWHAINRTISEFLSRVPPAQSMRVRGEDLLAEPDKVLTDVAAWLGLRTDSEALDRMKHPECSPYAFPGPPGARYGNDNFFLENPVFRPRPAAEPLALDGPLGWRSDGAGFCPEVQLLAREFGYK